ncbi:MAG TPA: recombination protein O N-terminal domain-containing protein [bacterium]|nr:recombination protein O N-terminal domain-containing protein [bacterium]
MSQTTSERLLILKRREYHEHDAIITAFSPERGRLSLLARGLAKPQSKLAGHLEPITIVDGLIVWSHRPILSSTVSRQSFIGLKDQLAAVVLAGQVINRFLNWCLVGQAMPEAWHDLVDLFSYWNESPRSLATLTWTAQAAQWRLANYFGYAPDLSSGQIADSQIKVTASVGQLLDQALTDDWLELTKLSSSPTILEQVTDFFNQWLNFLDYNIC